MANNPYMAYRFQVEVEGLVVGGFTEASGIGATVNLEEPLWEGGANDFVYHFPKNTTYPKLVLKHGLTDSNTMYAWFQKTVTGKIQRKNVTIYLIGNKDEHVRGWSFYKAWPVDWQGPTFDASRSPIATESFTLVHQGMTVNG